MKLLFNSFLVFALTGVISCSSNKKDGKETSDTRSAEMGRKATAHLTAGKETKAEAHVTFENTGSGIRVIAHATGLKPNSQHGFHVHENGKCEMPDFKSAGGHFNPHGKAHSSPHSPNRHLGDMGNLISDDKGVAHLEILLRNTSKNDLQAMVGRAVIIHAKRDDLKTQPTGDSGDRIACGLIQSI